MMRLIILALLPLLLIARAQSQSFAGPDAPATQSAKAPATAPSAVRAISVSEFRQLQKDHPDYVVLDVRTPQEWSTGIIPGAKLIDIKSSDFDDKVAQLDKSKTYLVYCRTGNRSSHACSKLQTLDMSAYNLKGGIVAWKEAKLPTTQPTR
jgi:rhodanese-related sulfurtransferase